MGNRASRTVINPIIDGGRQVINVDVTDGTFLSPFVLNDNYVITAEAANFVESALEHRHYKRNISLNIIERGDESKAVKYEQAVRNYYLSKFVEYYRRIKRKLFFSLIMLVAGIMSLGLMVVANLYGWGFIVGNIIDIVAWVFLWEAADVFFFQRFELRRKLTLCSSLYHAKITVSTKYDA